MAFIRQNKIKPDYQAIAYERSDGSNLIATAHCSLDRITDYLDNQDCEQFLCSNEYDKLKSIQSFSLLRSVFAVTQKQGVATSLMNEYLNENTDPCLILVVDLSEGKWLVDFYRKFGYELVSNDELPVMIKFV